MKRIQLHLILPALFALCWLGFAPTVSAQGYTSFFTGDTADVVATATGGVCMMGGATEDDNAMRWFLQRCGGGDVLVMRATGSSGYNAYLYSQLGVTVNSVETIRFDNASAATDPYVRRRIAEAEAIWFAGGDQWDYVTYWRGTGIDALINDAIHQRHAVIGGTSAGMAILGGYYFSAANGTITSAAAIANPYDAAMTVDGTPFLDVDYLSDVITDTHYDYYDRRGRQLAFLARILTDDGIAAHGIACDEYTAVCVGPDGIAHVYGDSPNSDDNAYFLTVNCDVPSNVPEVCVANQPLSWDQGSMAIKVYNIKGTPDGDNTLNLNDWKTGFGGVWEDWSVYNSVLFALPSAAPTCNPVGVQPALADDALQVYPNPARGGQVNVLLQHFVAERMSLRNSLGQVVWSSGRVDASTVEIDLGALPAGYYWLQGEGASGVVGKALILR